MEKTIAEKELAKREKQLYKKMDKAENDIMKALNGFNQYQVAQLLESIKHQIKFNSIVEFN